MQDDPDCKAVYWEMVGLFKDLFVSFYFDPERERLYQICSEGTRCYLDKGDPEWKPLTEAMPETLVRMERLQAERLEDDWRDAHALAHTISETVQDGKRRFWHI